MSFENETGYTIIDKYDKIITDSEMTADEYSKLQDDYEKFTIVYNDVISGRKSDIHVYLDILNNAQSINDDIFKTVNYIMKSLIEIEYNCDFYKMLITKKYDICVKEFGITIMESFREHIENLYEIMKNYKLTLTNYNKVARQLNDDIQIFKKNPSIIITKD